MLALVCDGKICSLKQWSKTYGSVMMVYLGPQRVVVLVGYDAVKEALVDQAEEFSARAPIPLAMRIVKGYGTSNVSVYFCSQIVSSM